MVPYGTYSPAAGLAAPGAYPYIGGPRYGYGSRYGYGPRFGYGARYGYGPRFGYGRAMVTARTTATAAGAADTVLFSRDRRRLARSAQAFFLCRLYTLTARLAT
jgi:hypothetical protein